jgi:hypothetical protein
VNEIAGFGKLEFQKCMKRVMGSPKLNTFSTVSMKKIYALVSSMRGRLLMLFSIEPLAISIS